MEELILCLLLAGNELDIVHQKQIHIAVLVVKFLRSAGLDGPHKLVCKLVTLDVNDALSRVALLDGVADGKQQVGLAETGVAVDKEGIVGLARIVRNRHGGGVGEAVGVAHDEVVKGVARHLRQGVCVVLAAWQIVPFGQHDHLKVGSEEIIERGFDAIAEALGDDFLLEFRAGQQHQAAVVQLQRDTVEKPGIHGCGCQLCGQNVQHLLPYILDGIHDLYPLRCAFF